MWKTKIKIAKLKGSENPRIFKFSFERKGGKLCFSRWQATFREDELNEIKNKIDSVINDEK